MFQALGEHYTLRVLSRPLTLISKMKQENKSLSILMTNHRKMRKLPKHRASLYHAQIIKWKMSNTCSAYFVMLILTVSKLKKVLEGADGTTYVTNRRSDTSSHKALHFISYKMACNLSHPEWIWAYRFIIFSDRHFLMCFYLLGLHTFHVLHFCLRNIFF
jgi:hypothetical protein